MRDLWQPIETAPKDGTDVLLFSSQEKKWPIRRGYWSNNEYSKKPRPYWSTRQITGYSDRMFIPTHWQPLLPPVTEGAP